MNQKPAKLSDNLIDEDSLAQTGHEVVLVDDHQLAQKFFQNNQDALVNSQAVFTNIDALSPQQILVANEIEDINAELRATTLKDVSSQEIALKNLLEEDYQKKK